MAEFQGRTATVVAAEERNSQRREANSGRAHPCATPTPQGSATLVGDAVPTREISSSHRELPPIEGNSSRPPAKDSALPRAYGTSQRCSRSSVLPGEFPTSPRHCASPALCDPCCLRF